MNDVISKTDSTNINKLNITFNANGDPTLYPSPVRVIHIKSGYNEYMSKTNQIDDVIDDAISVDGMSKLLHIPKFISKIIIELSVYFGSFRRFYVVELGSEIVGVFQKEKNAKDTMKSHKNSKLRLVYGQPK